MLNNAETKKLPVWLIPAIALATVLVVVILFFAVQIFNQPSTPKQFIQADTKDLKIKGNRNSKIYHLQGCPNYDDIAERNIVWFKTKEEAENAGYRMARNC